VSQNKTVHLTFDHNFGKCRSIFKILILKDSQGNIFAKVMIKSQVYCFIFKTWCVYCSTVCCLLIVMTENRSQESVGCMGGAPIGAGADMTPHF